MHRSLSIVCLAGGTGEPRRSKKGNAMRLLITAAFVTLAVGIGTAGAQAPAPSTVAPVPQAATTVPDKAAISKSCTDQANAKGLHGKSRKKFRSECKRGGGKTP
jgi:hypothetical protein